jgi:iron complex transport system substrate-binding protein
MMRKPILMIFLLVILTALLLSGCAPAAVETSIPVEAATPSSAPEPVQTEVAATQAPGVGSVSLTDGLDRTVELAGPAQRVVSLAASNTEILFAIGAGSQVIGRDDFSDTPAEVKDLPSIGGSFSGYNNEAIVALQPDLVLAAEINTAEQVQALSDLGLTVYYLSNPVDMDGLYQNLVTVGRLTGHEAEAQALSESLKARVEAVTSKTLPLSKLTTVFYELDSTDPNAPYTAGPGTFIDTLIGMAGGHNVGSVLETQYGQLSAEELLVQDPDIILLGDAAYGVTAESVGQRAGWENLSAVKNGRVFPFDDNLASRPGPRLVDGLETLAKLLHPELFP